MAEEMSQIGDLKVMVIDDSKTIRRTAENLLKKEGCEVFTAVDGFEALSKIAQGDTRAQPVAGCGGLSGWRAATGRWADRRQHRRRAGVYGVGQRPDRAQRPVLPQHARLNRGLL